MADNSDSVKQPHVELRPGEQPHATLSCSCHGTYCVDSCPAPPPHYRPMVPPGDAVNMQLTPIQATVRFDLTLEPAAASRLYWELDALAREVALADRNPAPGPSSMEHELHKQYPTLADLFRGLFECGAHE